MAAVAMRDVVRVPARESAAEALDPFQVPPVDQGKRRLRRHFGQLRHVVVDDVLAADCLLFRARAGKPLTPFALNNRPRAPPSVELVAMAAVAPTALS